MRSVYAVPGFARLWWAATISGLGSPMTLLAVNVLVVTRLGGSTADVGLVASARWLPYLAAGALVGVAVDRRRRLPLMVATDLALAVLLLAVPALWWLGLLSIPALMVIMALMGCCTLVADAASQSVVPRVVPRDRLQEAHARLDQSDAVAQVSGPAVGGAVIRVIGPGASIVVDAVSYLVSALLVRGVRVEEPPPAPAGGTSYLDEVREGLRWVYRRSRLGTLALVTHGWFVCNAVLGPVYTTYVLRGLQRSEVALGLTLSTAGLGALAGASVSTAVGRRLDAGRTIATAHAVTAVGVSVMAVAALVSERIGPGATIVLLGAGQAVHGFAMGLSNSHEMGYRQLITPDALQARTNITMRSVNRAMVVVSAPLGGLLADRAGFEVALAVTAVGFALVTAASWCSSVRRASYADAAPG